IVYREGEPCETIYLIISGRCESHREDNGHTAREVFGPGDMLGERELLNQDPYRTTVRVVTHSILLRLSGSELQKLFTAQPSLAGRFSQSINQRLKLERGHSSRSERRIVSLLCLSPEVHEHALAQRLAKSVVRVTRESLLLVHMVPVRQRLSLADWAALAPAVNGEFCFAKELHENSNGYHELTIQVGKEPAEAAHIASLLSHFGAHFHYVIVQLSSVIGVASTIEALIQSDLGYVFLQSSTENFYNFRLLITELDAQTKGCCGHVKPIVCAEQSSFATELASDLSHLGHPVHSFMRGYPITGSEGTMDRGGNYPLLINTLAREIGRCRVGLALSSGGAKGLAHIGVIQVLEENGIEIDAVAGASMGAYVGAVWAYGHDGQTCEKIAREVERRWGLLYVFDPVMPPRQGFLRTERAVQRLRRSIGQTHFSQMYRPLRVVATYLDTLERVVFSTGEVARAVQASIAIPGICVPVKIDGEVFIDGGIADPLPVDVLGEMGIERIIAVNTIPTPERLRHCLDAEREQRDRHEHRFTLGGFFNKHLNYFARGNVLDIMLRSIHGVQTRVAENSGREADVVLRPWDCDARWHDFTHPGKYIALGRKVAEDQLPQLKALAQKHEPAELAVAV
ncbi:MAG: hypothetical protein QOD99_2551, partial [Chthoniobacter sp.]|nr:hypothetical protein [Chthoniobacter sp.]